MTLLINFNFKSIQFRIHIMPLADGYTVVKNVSGTAMTFSFLPPHGQRLANNETLSIPGDFPNTLAINSRKRKFTALEAAVASGRLEVSSRPASAFSTVTEATTARTLLLTDAKRHIRCTNASAVAVTVPPQVSVRWVAGTEILVERAGAGSLTIVAGAGVTLRSPRTLVADAQYSVVSVRRVALNEWVVSGDTA